MIRTTRSVRSYPKIVFSYTLVLLGVFAQSLLAQSALETALAATVTIEVAGPDGVGHGSGFITSSDGMIITAAHVIEGVTAAVVRLQNGEELNVEGVIAIDGEKDFAIVRVAGFDLPTLPLGNADDLSIGQRVLVIGAPIDAALAGTVSDGLVAADRLIAGTRTLQISAPTSPGNSGGPVLTEEGQVIGLVVAGIQAEGAENLNFALPINYVRGQLALAASRPLRALADIEVTSRANVEDPGRDPSPSSSSSSLPAMNTELELDADALHGASFWSHNIDGEYNLLITTNYRVLPIPSGGRKLERAALTEYWWGDQRVAQNSLVSFFNLDGSGAGSNWSTVAYDNRFSGWAGAWGWRTNGNTVLVDSSGVWRREFSAHPGVIPADMFSGMIAALDQLPIPGQVTMWVGGYDTSQSSFWEDYRVEDLLGFVTLEHIRVPESMGARCELGVKLLSQGITVRAVEGASGSAYQVDNPHVNVRTAQRDGFFLFEDRVGADMAYSGNPYGTGHPCLSFRRR